MHYPGTRYNRPESDAVKPANITLFDHRLNIFDYRLSYDLAEYKLLPYTTTKYKDIKIKTFSQK